MRQAAVVWALTFLFLLPYFYAKDPYFVAGLLLALLLVFCLKKSGWRINWNAVDLGVISFLLYDGFALFSSSNPIGALEAFRTTFLSVTGYFVLRCWGDREEHWRALLGAYSVCIGLFSLLALSYFFLFSQTVHALGFSDLYDFRFMLCPLGVVSNEWASLQLLFGGVVALAWHYCKGRKMQITLSVVGSLVFLQALWSFSRGMYLSLLLLLIGLILFLRKSLKRKPVIVGIVLLLGIAGTVFISSNSEVMRTLKMTETISQRRSIATRINTWSVTDAILKEHPLGVGNGNYQVAVDRYWVGEKGNETYASYAMNVVSQLLVEKGWIGLLLYGGTFCLLCISLYRKHRRTAWLAALFLIVYLFREQAFSAFFSSSRVQWLFFTLLAIVQIPDRGKEIKKEGMSPYLLFLPLIIWGFCLSMSLVARKKLVDNERLLSVAASGDWKDAERCVEDFEGEAPLLLNRSLFFWDRFLEEGNEEMREKAKDAIEKAKRLNPYDVQMEFYGEMVASADLDHYVKMYPHKLMFVWAAYLQAEQRKDQIKSRQLLVDCILLHPRLLDSDYWRTIVKERPAFYKEVSDDLLSKIQGVHDDENPFVLAKMGSIALKFGNFDWAEKLLARALEQLPNLSMAWFNRGIVKEKTGDSETALLYKKRGILLGLRMIIPNEKWKRYLQTGPQGSERDEAEGMAVAGYDFRFHAWYGYRLFR